jgi:hypothetical protein
MFMILIIVVALVGLIWWELIVYLALFTLHLSYNELLGSLAIVLPGLELMLDMIYDHVPLWFIIAGYLCMLRLLCLIGAWSDHLR